MARERFSDRHGFNPQEVPITVRNDAPDELRSVVVDLAYEFGLRPRSMRELVCAVLRKRPDPSNWSEYPNVDGEVREKVDEAQWYRVYDIIEDVYDQRDEPQDEAFAKELNKYFRETGIGWQLADGELQIRGTDALEATVATAGRLLSEACRKTAAAELQEALRDLSGRPEPDITGAVQHALAAVECAARDFTGDAKATLGELIKRNPDFLPAPLDAGVSKIWGFASEHARHLREGGEPSLEDAHLVVGVAAAICNYISMRS